MAHANAALTPKHRLRLARLIVDDRLVFSVTETQLSWLDPTFNSPLNIRLNLQVGGSMPAYYNLPVGEIPTGTGDYVVDYVRVYQK